MNLACLNCFGAYPHAFDLSTGQLYADTLQVGAECALAGFNQLQTDASAFFAETFVNDAASANGAFAGDCADSGHIRISPLVVKNVIRMGWVCGKT